MELVCFMSCQKKMCSAAHRPAAAGLGRADDDIMMYDLYIEHLEAYHPWQNSFLLHPAGTSIRPMQRQRKHAVGCAPPCGPAGRDGRTHCTKILAWVHFTQKSQVIVNGDKKKESLLCCCPAHSCWQSFKFNSFVYLSTWITWVAKGEIRADLFITLLSEKLHTSVSCSTDPTTNSVNTNPNFHNCFDQNDQLIRSFQNWPRIFIVRY